MSSAIRVIASISFLCALSPTVAQQTIYIDGTTGDDAWSGLCAEWDGGTCGPKATIQAGIDDARRGDDVVIFDGIYWGAGNKDLDFGGKAITVRSGSGDPATCVIDCEGDGRGFYFHNGENAGSVVQGLTIQNAHTDFGSVYCYGASPTLTNCIIADGIANSGAGVACSHYSNPTLTNCIIRDNMAAYGAGVWCFQDSNPTLTNCTITGNKFGDFGAGLDCHDSNPTLTDCIIAGNSTEYGGGAVHCYHASPTLTNCTILNNNGGENGGGLYSRYDSNPTLTDCTITGNTCNNRGGGIFCDDATATLTNCTLRGNTADYGGGADCLSSSNPLLTNCTITGNTATYHGGGVCCYESSPTLTNCKIGGNAANDCGGGIHCELDSNPSLTNCTVVGNTAESGGGVACSQYSSPTLTNCILWADMPREIYVDSSSPVVTYCNVQSGWMGIGNIDADPLFCDPVGPDGDPSTFADNDYRLSANSPCIDAGNNGAVPADVLDLDADGDTAEPQPFDLAGRPRFVDDPVMPDTGSGAPPIVDIGAYEYMLNGDCDLDWSISLDDFTCFAGCMQGPAVIPQPGCGCADTDVDGDVDLADFVAFQAAFAEP
jgi:parallel beta-helix repeat protein